MKNKPMMAFLMCGFLLMNAANVAATAFPAVSGKEIIEKMHRKWAGKWYRNLQFEQTVDFYKENKMVKQEVWQELLNAPGNLHLRFNGFETGNGAIFRNDSVYYFTNGVMTRKEERIHQLLLLGFDVYFQDPEVTIQKLTKTGIDLSRGYDTIVDHRPVRVLGTNDPKDRQSNQCWIDQENWYLLKVGSFKNGHLSEIDFGAYKTIQGYPVATEITFKTDGQLMMVEKYFNISFPITVPSVLYDPLQFQQSRW